MKIYNGIPTIPEMKSKTPLFPIMIGFIANDNMRFCISTIVRFKYQNRYYLRHHVEFLNKHVERVGIPETMELYERINFKCYGTIVKGIPNENDDRDDNQMPEDARYINAVISENKAHGTGLAALSNTPNG